MSEVLCSLLVIGIVPDVIFDILLFAVLAKFTWDIRD